MEWKNFFMHIIRIIAWPLVWVIAIFIISGKSDIFLSSGLFSPTVKINSLSQVQIWIDAFIAIGTVGATLIALIVTLRNFSDLKREKLSGINIAIANQEAIIILENKSKVDVNIDLRSHVLTNGHQKNESLHYLQLPDEDIKEKLIRETEWKPLRKNNLSSGESIKFHLMDVGNTANVYVVFIALKLVIDNKRTKYYVLRFAGVKSSESDILPLSHPLQQWIVTHSFVE